MPETEDRQRAVPSFLRHRRCDWGTVLVLASIAWSAPHAIWLLLRPAQPLAQEPLYYLLPGFVALVMLARLAMAPGLSARARRGWMLMLSAWALYFCADLLWSLYVGVLGIEPFPSLCDVLYLSYYALVLGAVRCLSRPFASRHQRLRFLLDLAILLVGVGALLGLRLVVPMLADPDLDPLGLGFNIAYITGDLMVLLAVTWQWASDGRSFRAPGALALAAAMMLSFLGDVIFFLHNTEHSYVTGDSSDALYLLAYTAIAMAAHQRLRAHRAGVADSVAQTRARHASFMPYLVAALSYGFLLYPNWTTLDSTAGVVVGVSIVLSGLLLARVVLNRIEFLDLLARSEARFSSLVRHSTDAVLLLDAEQRVSFVTDSSERVLGLDRQDLEQRGLVDRLHRDDVPLWQRMRAMLAAEPGTPARFELRLQDRSGPWRTIEISANDLLHDPDVNAIVLNCRDVTDRKRLQEELQHMAFTDSLTMLGNRNVFRERVSHALARASRDGSLVPVLFLDVDNFKTINDSLGHLAGDQMLVSTAQRLVRETRPGDTVARLGGDEFGVLIEEARSSAEVVAIADRILTSLRRPFLIEGNSVMAPVSIGVAFGGAADTVDDVLRNADLAMYEAKSAGKSCCRVFEPKMHVAARDRLELESDLRRALDHGELELHYQPIVDLARGACVSCEALLRWRHPQRGWLSPALFIPVAEESGLIVELGRWTLTEACRTARELIEILGRDGFRYVAVNISGRHLQHSDLERDVCSALEATGLAPSMLVLEITESVLMHEAEATTHTMQAIKRLGVRVAMDDFGTGYSSLSYLHRFPIDILKVDRSFVQRLGSSADGSALARSVIAIGQTLKLDVVAEGVETNEQLDELRALGCGYAQGYLFARPGTAEALRRAWSSVATLPAGPANVTAIARTRR